jgi:hypothetical protein
MISVFSVLLLSAVAMQSDTTVVLGMVERDLTGDGNPEILRLVGTGKTIDSLDVTLLIESFGKTAYRISLAPLTRRVGFDENRRVRSHAQQRKWVAEFGRRFFGDSKFVRPAAFLSSWRSQAPGRLAEIPEYIARDGAFYPDTVRAKFIWSEMQRSGVTIFEFSPGGDAVVAIGWSGRDRRFYRVMECC